MATYTKFQIFGRRRGERNGKGKGRRGDGGARRRGGGRGIGGEEEDGKRRDEREY